MSDYGDSSRPLTRREIRERAEAERAAREAAAVVAPPPVVSTPAAAPRTPPPSRRSMRASGDAPPAAIPIVRPPAASNGMRSLDETGRLTAIHETSDAVPILGTASTLPPQAPQRRSSLRRAEVAQSDPGAVVPPALMTPHPGPWEPSGERSTVLAPPPVHQADLSPGGLAWEARVEVPAPAPAPPVTELPPVNVPFTSPSVSVAGPGEASAPPMFPSLREPAPADTSAPFASFSQPGVEDHPLPGAMAGGSPFAPAVDQSMTPRSEAVFPPVAEAVAFPPSSASGNPDSGGTFSPFSPMTATNDSPSPFMPISIEGVEEEELRPRPEKATAGRRGSSYTWLQYIILMVIAMVMGALIWKLMERGSESDARSEEVLSAVHTEVPVDDELMTNGET